MSDGTISNRATPRAFTDADFRRPATSTSTAATAAVTAPAAAPAKAKPVDLLAQWKGDVVNALAEEIANHEVQERVGAEAQKIETERGYPLDESEVWELVADQDLFRSRVTQDAAQHYGASPQSVKEAVDSSVTRYRPYLDGVDRGSAERPPFNPLWALASGDPGARAREGKAILFENKDLLVVADAFSPSPKALIVPKSKVMFPVDNPALLKKLADVGAAVSDAFSAAKGTPEAKVWINPPQVLTIPQMHVHVLPDLPPWSDVPLDRTQPEPKKITLAKEQLYAAVRAELKKSLGASAAAPVVSSRSRTSFFE